MLKLGFAVVHGHAVNIYVKVYFFALSSLYLGYCILISEV